MAHAASRFEVASAQHRLLRLRKQKRDFMRRWRANPENRRREILSQMQHRKVRRAVHSEERKAQLCGFCHIRPPVEIVDRLAVTDRGFRRFEVAYCGRC